MEVLDKNYTKMQTADDPGTIGTKNQAQMGEIEADMAIVETAVNKNETDITGKASSAEVETAKNCDNHISGATNKVFTATEQNKLSGAEDGATADQSANEIKTAYESNADTNSFTDAEKTKVASVESGATEDQTGAEIKALYEAEADTNNYSDSEKAKLGSIDATHYLAPLSTTTELAALTGMTDKARVYVEGEITDYFYDKQASSGDIEAPVADGGWWKKVISSGESAASIKTKYESNADTNAYTDAEKTKVTSVETDATADQTDSEIETAYNNQVSASSQAEAEAGTETEIRRFSPLRIFQAIKAWIVDSGGWISYSGTMPVFVSTTNGIDSLTLTDADDFLFTSTKVEITSGAGTHMYYAIFADATGFELVGETSPSGTITAMRYSYADAPFGFKKGENWFKARAYRATSDQTLSDNTTTQVQFNAETFDLNANFVSYEYTVPISGYYNILSSIYVEDSTYKIVLVIGNVRKNGSNILSDSSLPTQTYNGRYNTISIGGLVYLERGSVIDMTARCDVSDSGTSVIKQDSNNSHMSIQFTGI